MELLKAFIVSYSSKEFEYCLSLQSVYKELYYQSAEHFKKKLQRLNNQQLRYYLP